MLGPAIVSRINATAAITNLIADRLYAKVVPEHTKAVYPLMAYVVEDQDREGTYDSGGSGLNSAKVTIACLALDPKALANLRKAVLDVFDDTSGTWGATVIQGSFFEDENELASRDPTTGEESLYFGTELQFLVWYEA